jgi:putative membrane protein insertion efficiency factor
MPHFSTSRTISEACGDGLPIAWSPMPDDVAAAPTPLTIPQRIALVLVRGYQLMFSPFFAGSCRFVPSCSAYAVDAIARFGVFRGSLLALRRLARCRPLAAHGFDPVPPAALSRTGAGRNAD